MRRFISISLLLLFTLPLVSPLFAASTADANVPICCQRNGRHHCAMPAVVRSSSSDATQNKAASFQERCPYNLVSPVEINLLYVPDKPLTAIFAGTVSNPARLPQTEARLRIAFDRSHQKRGPPSLILSNF